MRDRLKGKIAIITGAASGIGAATAERFIREGANVVMLDRDGARLLAVAQRIDPDGKRSRRVRASVENESAAQECVRIAQEVWGRLDILVNNAAVDSDADLLEITSDEFDRVIGANLRGPIFLCKHAVPAMLASGGAIINIASISATCGIPGQPVYALSKAGLLQLTRQLACEYAERGIRVNAVSPGTIETPMLRRPKPDLEKQEQFIEWLRMRHPMRRFGQPEEVANAILFLASDEASFITGANLAVDGGYTAE
jgi:NAD(P)-dependent dehydrogenase (short-subunit alcohol dehydrogenase family)